MYSSSKKHPFILAMVILSLNFRVSTFAEDLPLFPQSPFIQTGEFTPAIPVIGCDSPIFNFSHVIDGTIIHHTFIIKNDGDSLLKIQKVKTGCGCSTVDFDTAIEPGKTGKIALKIDTDGYGGTFYEDEIVVESSDPQTPVFKLKAKGPVDALAVIKPKGVSFKGNAQDTHKTNVMIEPNANYRFHITGIDQGKLKDKIKCTLDKQNNYWQLTILNVMKQPGRYWGKIQILTDHPQKKSLDLWVSAVLK
jgi:hypothetical protein